MSTSHNREPSEEGQLCASVHVLLPAMETIALSRAMLFLESRQDQGYQPIAQTGSQ